ncbi:SpaH/EbpB family LPXTG-anchored major pilin [uncultured Eubacterium sp.]|uniref:SpaH/EbpB family LPXTG-anchored major pilin n=1 Tax=uncultured Eubacterium sp. TaxID=165185 RepID=UPI0025945061|nr:SpaH/EbpB family LPXTG-anchored major pilin [uncultured Eubacterium sp.]
MKKMKKILAVILSLAMVLGMSMTAFAGRVTDRYNDQKINVTNLAQGVDTTVTLLNFIYLDEDATGNQSWKVVDWAKNYVSVNQDGTYTITDKEALRTAALTAAEDSANYDAGNQKVVAGTETSFENVPVGAYVITATDSKGVYGLMVANTYKDDSTYMATKVADVAAKMNDYNVTKTTNDTFVHRGQNVTFTVTTQMAPYKNGDETLKTFKIKDTPTNLKVTALKSVSVNGTPVDATTLAAIQAAVSNTIDDTTGCTTEYVVDLTKLVKTNVAAGSTIEIQYEATVMSDTGYQNTATALADTVTYGNDETSGTEGSVTIKKVGKNSAPLNGAQFELLKDTEKNGQTVKEAVSVVKVSDGVYRHALVGETGATTIMDVADDGTLTVKGLDEGTYYFHETKAPESYKLVDTPTAGKEITAGNTTTVDFGEFVNTKLSSLPSTGGMGTTLFTIAGCAIMVAAAGFFFASRKRVNK